MVDPTQLGEKTYYDDLMEDIQNECQKYGRIVQILIPRPSKEKTNVSGMGYVFVEFGNIEQAQRAKKEITGMKFYGRKVEASNYPEDSFRRGQLDY